MTRRSLTRAQRVRVFNKHGGICHLCGLKIHAERGEKWEVEHVRALWKKGDDILENMRPAHERPCHRDKTDEEATERAKEFRMAANYLGVPKSGPKMRGHRDDDITITMRRGVQPRIKGKGARHRQTMAALWPFGRPE